MTARPAILAELRRRERAGEPAPTMRELMYVSGASSLSVVWAALDRLCADGLIVHGPGIARSTRLTDAGRGLPSDQELLERCYAALPRGELKRVIGDQAGEIIAHRGCQGRTGILGAFTRWGSLRS